MSDFSTLNVEFLRLQEEVAKLKMALNLAESKHRTANLLLDHVEDIVTVHDAKGYVYFETPSIERELGYSLTGKHPVEFVHPEDIKLLMKVFLKALHQGVLNQSVLFRTRSLDGSYLLIESKVSNFYNSPELNGLLVVSKNVTQNELNIEALRQTQETLTAILANSGIAYLLLNKQGDLNFIKGDFLTKSGFDETNFVGKNIQMLRNEFPQLYEGAQQALDGKKKSIIARIKEFTFEAWFVPVVNNQGKPDGAIGILNDITAFEFQRGTERLYRTLFELSPVGILLESTDGIILDANQAICKLTGYSVPELIGKHVSIFAGSEAYAVVNEHIKRIVEGEKLVLEVESYRKDGSTYFAELTETCITLANNQKAVLSLSNDISQRKQFENALKEGEIKYRNIFENIQDVFYQTDINGVITTISPSIHRYSGYTPNELIGLNVANLYYDISEREGLLALIKTKGEAVDYEIRLLSKKGQISHVSVNAHFITGLNGEIIGVEGSLRDVSERRLAIQQIQRLSLAVEQSPVMILVTSLSGVVEYVNNRYLETSGYSSSQIINNHLEVIFTISNPRISWDKLVEELKNHTIWKEEFMSPKADDGWFWVSASVSEIKNDRGEVLNYLIVLEDITEYKRIIEEIEEARARAEQSDKLKSTLLANLSHEFRTPMNGILGFAQILHYDAPSDEFRDIADKILLSSDRLMKTLDSIMWLAQIESGIDVYEEHGNLFDRIKPLLSNYSARYGAKGIEFKVSCAQSFAIKTDFSLVLQVLTELLDNALKFTEQGAIQLTICLLKANQKTLVEIEVSDTGIGIDPDMHELVFKEFRQVSEGINREYEGTGLGLAIVKKIAERIGGTIQIESELGKGSKFIFTFEAKQLRFPASTIDMEIIPSLPIVQKSISSPKIKALIVEDNEINRELIAAFLTGICEVEMAKDGTTALKLATEKQYDVFFMDINLRSSMDGLSLTRILRKMDIYKEVPIIAVTGFTLVGDKERLLSEGCSHYIAKPFERQEFVRFVKNILSINP
jgi:PAS domain S-box-containing protein